MPDRNGRLWLSWSDGHVGYMDATNAGIFDAKDVSLGPIYAIWPGKAHTWLGGEDGVAFTASNHVTPLWSGTDNPFKTVTGIVETERGELWINAAEGLYRIDQQGVTDLLSGHHPKPASMSLFSQEDGLQGGPGPYAPGPSLFEAGDGRIWISRLEGASWIDPNRILRNVEPSRAYIDGLEADNQKLSMVSGAARIPPNTHSLRIDYTSPELTAPDRVTFRYRLVGIDEDWQVVGSRRFALYTDPPLGRVGMTEARARATGRPLLVGRRPMTRVGRAIEKGETRGFMMTIADAETHQILGAAILGTGGDEAIHGILDAMNARMPFTALQRAVPIHPTVSELIPTVLGDMKPVPAHD